MKSEETNEIVNDEVTTSSEASTTVESSSSSVSNSDIVEPDQNKYFDDTNNQNTNDSTFNNINTKLTKSNTDSLITDLNTRKSVYDNHKWIDEDEDYYAYNENYTQIVGQLKKSENDNEISTMTITGSTLNQTNSNLIETVIETATLVTPSPVSSYQQLVFKSEKSINLTKSDSIDKTDQPSTIIPSLVAPIATDDLITTTTTTINIAPAKQERDDFDDLIDLTHRAPKKETSNNSITKTNSSTKLNEDITKASLPPLPYSFVKIEKSSRVSNKVGSNSSLNNMKEPHNNNNNNHNNNNNNYYNNSYNKTPAKTSTSTTRLFIPINNNSNNFNNLININKEETNNNKTSIMTTARSVDNLKINLNREPTISNINNNINNNNSDNVSYYTSQTINDPNNCYMMTNISGGSSTYSSVSSNSLSNKKQPNMKFNNNMVLSSNNVIKNNNTNGQEWDQISKIFASLETLLNDVVESTSKNLSHNNMIMSHNFIPSCVPLPNINKSNLDLILNTNNVNTANKNNLLYKTHGNYKSFDNFKSFKKENEDLQNNNQNMKFINDDNKDMTTSSSSLHQNDIQNFNNNKSQKHMEISKFLNKINLVKYEYKFLTNGYDDLYYLNNVMTFSDLIQIGIDNYDDMFNILKEIKLLPSAIKRIGDEEIKFESVEQWLNYLNLSEYNDNFILNNVNSMSKVEKLWEIELVTVFQIPFIGHRRRILASIDASTKLEAKKKPSSNHFHHHKPNTQNQTSLNNATDSEPIKKENVDVSEPASVKKSSSASKFLFNLRSSFSNNGNNSMNNGNQTKKSHGVGSLSESYLAEKFAKLTQSDKSSKKNFQQTKIDISDAEFNDKKRVSTQRPSSAKSSHSIQSNRLIDNLKAKKRNASFESKSTNSISKNITTSTPSTTPAPIITASNNTTTLSSSSNNTSTNASSNTQNNKKLPSSSSSTSSSSSLYDQQNENNLSKSNSNNNLDGYVSGGDQTRAPKLIWRNDPQLLIKSSHNFIVQYLGSSALTKLKTNQDPVKYTIDRLKNTAKASPYPSPKVELALSIHGIKLLHAKTKELLWNHDIKHINNVCQDQDDLNFFAFSTQNDPSAHYYCHVFACKDKELTTKIILTIGQAFDIAYELFCKNNFS